MAREIDIKLRTTYDGKGGDAAEIDEALFPSRFGLHALFAVRNESGKQVDDQNDDKDGDIHATSDYLGLCCGFVHHFIGRGKQFPPTLHVEIKFIVRLFHVNYYTTNA